MRRRALAALVIGWSASLTCVAWSPGTSAPDAVDGFSVDRQNRLDVLAFYQTVYQRSEGYPQSLAWTGNVTAGLPGTTAQAFKNDVLRRINFYRAMTGLPADITLEATKSAKDQEAALMFSANDDLSHEPPTDWVWYTANASEAAGNSNIALGTYGPGSVDAYIRDDGSNNLPVGHRRWLLYPRAREMGTGDVPASGSFAAANAIWVIGNFKASAPPAFVAWPNAGYVPQGLVPARWSLSYPGAGFGNATVTVTRNGTPLTVNIVSRTDNGYGDNTIVWEPSALVTTGAADVNYAVTVAGISGAGVPASLSYSVTSFAPYVLGANVTIAGTEAPPATGQAYSFNSIPQADAYQLRVSTGSGAAWLEGAENSPAPLIADNTAASYALRQSSVKRTGSLAFQLTFPLFADGDQGFEITRDIVPSASSQLIFYDLFRFVTTASRLSAEVSEDAGSSWTEVWGRNGNGSGSSTGWDTSFQARSVSLAAFTGRPVRVRFVFRSGNSAFLGTSANTGVFVDDMSVTNSTELVNTTVTPLTAQATSFVLDENTAGGALATGSTYYLRIRPNVGTKWFGDGPLKIVTAVAPTGLQTFRKTHLLAIDGSQDTAQPAGDGVANLLKYAFNMIGSGTGQASTLTLPNALALAPGGSAGLPFTSVSPATGRLQITYIRRKSTTQPGITYAVEFSSSLATGSWSENAAASESAVSIDATFERITVTDSAAFTKRFARVRVSAP